MGISITDTGTNTFGPNTAGAAINYAILGGTVDWTNASNVSSSVAYATVTTTGTEVTNTPSTNPTEVARRQHSTRAPLQTIQSDDDR